jgi:Ca2+/Na+ antiporter
VAGIGYGAFIIIVFLIISIIICIASRSTQHPELYSLIGAIFPVFFILFFVFMPKKSQQPTTTPSTDSNFVPHIIFVILFFAMFVSCLK